MGRCPVSCMSLTRRLSATVSPPSTALTRRGESSKYSTWSLGGPTSKLNDFSPWSPNGPVPMVNVMACSSVGLLRPHVIHPQPPRTILRQPCRGRILNRPHQGNRCVFTERARPNTEVDRAPACRARHRRRCEPGGKGRKMHRETGTAEVNGARIHYEVAGEGEPLVLVHAGIADSRMWEGQIPAFSERYRVVAYDLRGFGRSEMVEWPFSHHEDLRGLLDFLGVERTHLVG